MADILGRLGKWFRFINCNSYSLEGNKVKTMSNAEADSADRKNTPIATGCFDYFPDALAEVARLSKIGNDKHNPGEPLHWSREKSSDHADCILRHMRDRGMVDEDGILHDVKVAWRALAMAQIAIEKYRETHQTITLDDALANVPDPLPGMLISPSVGARAAAVQEAGRKSVLFAGTPVEDLRPRRWCAAFDCLDIALPGRRLCARHG